MKDKCNKMTRKSFIGSIFATIGSVAAAAFYDIGPSSFSGEDLMHGIQMILSRCLYEENTAEVRGSIREKILNYMSEYCYKNNLTSSAYDVICDETNNTYKTVEQNKLNVDVMFKLSSADSKCKVLNYTVSCVPSNFSII